ncbi:MAG TPA: type II toxin-antitoxin system HicB family antitoxin [Candidatus Binataceae bacterium]|nr:type II toxin-antitoxin system HicB family antitoxin [Candidatus Binataceae bacterium]HVA78348.1 type II toxin-antitoxin system HicB family antitoxin [Candidatus Binataceae bacterium]
MKLKVIVHKSEEGGFWAEVPTIPGCATQGETEKELLSNIYEAIVGCLSADTERLNRVSADREVEEVEIMEAA